MTTGIYIRQISPGVHGAPDEAAARAADHGVDFVAILIGWQQDGRQREYNDRELLPYAEAFVRAGVAVHLWAYPEVGMEELLVRLFRRRTAELGGLVSGWVVDPERGFKWVGGRAERVVRLGARALMDGLVDAMDESLIIGVTSYGAMRGHRNFPWDVFCAYGWQSPQVYNLTGATLANALADWRAAAGPSAKMIPSVQAYGEYDESELGPWVDRLYEIAPDIDGIMYWSWRQISRGEWPIVSRIAARHRLI